MTMSIRLSLRLTLLFAVFLACLSSVSAFAPRTSSLTSASQQSTFNSIQQQGWSSSGSSTQLWDRRLDKDENVNVNIIPDVDAATLTAIGFGAIAFNFFVLANMGDGGIAGVLATIINSVNQ